MKNTTLGFNIILALAVLVLFYLHFSSNKTPIAVANINTVVADGKFKIAYFEMDSLENHYEYFIEVRNVLRGKDQENGRQLSEMKNTFAAKYQELQKTAQGMTQAEVNGKQQELMQMEKTFQNKEQMLNQDLQNESFKRLQDVKRKVEDYLKEYNKDKGYSYVLTSSPDLIYLKDSVYNITSDLIQGLNKQYKKK
ncbi:MAG: OmpH family outer membrane protein [Bacteroidetes bacterium]|nr:OmpH family outer membrane protein [Bacteroidota bacterium]